MKKNLLLFCFLFSLSLHAVTTINVTTAGTLTNLISAEDKAIITNLTLTGNIDARDFKCIRDEMPLLEVLDMSTVTIDAFTGDGGTYDDFFNKTYLANEVPRSSFSIYGSTSLIKSLTLPTSLTSIGIAAIAHCSKLESITIPSGVKTIKDNAFSNCDKLTGITLPGSLTSIGASAFENCLALTSVNIPSSVQSIGSSAFYYCPNLNTIYAYPAVPIDLSSSSTVFGGVNFHVLFVPSGSVDAYKAANQWKDLINVYDIATPVSKTIDVPTAGLLSSLLSADEKNILVTLTINGNIDARDVKCLRDEMQCVANIDLSAATIQAFNGSGGTNFNLDTDTYPANQMPITSFEARFGSKKTLKTIKLPNTLTSIGLGAFEGCKNLTTVTIPATVTSIGDAAFSTCYSLNSIYALSASPINIATSSDVFYGVENSTCTLYVSAGSKVPYQAADKWKDFTNIVEITLLPIITTNVASSITTTSTISGGTISNTGASPVTMRGVCWSTAANPTISDSKTIDGVGVGVFSSSITGLLSGITYHVRAYATNDFGTSYGSDLTFATTGSAPTIITTAAGAIHSTTAVAGGNITSEGSPPVTARGVCWSTAANPTVSDSKTINGTASGTFVSSMTGLTSNTTYHFRAYATNSVGTSYGDDLTFKTLVNDPTVTIDVPTAGTLSTLISAADKATITNLTLTGNIDARDVKCLRDEMPLLARLDMSEVSIQAYTGTAGTSTNTWTINYPANEMPESSFKLNSYSNYHLKEFYFPKTIISIGETAFDGCAGLTNIVIPEKVTTIRPWAFRCCYGVLNISISASVSTIGDNAFRFCYINKAYNVASDNPYYSSMDGVLYNKDKTVLICFPEGKEGDFVVPNSVTSIANSAFRENHLKNITIPTTVSSIGSYAFMDSYYLTQITIPSSIVTIAEYSFSYCEKLTSITIPASVTTIEYRAFYGDDSISEYKVDSANPNYASVDGILFDKNKTVLVQFPAAKTNNSYSIPNSVTTLSDASFFECLNLTTVFIPNSVSVIKGSAFSGCKNLATIVVDKATPINLSTSYNTFYSVDKAKCVLYVPIGSKAAYQAADQWKDFTNIVEGVPPTVVTSLPNSITTNTAIVGGNVISEGAYPVIGRGVCWSTSANPTIANSKTTDGTGSGEFSSSITGLASYVSYYVRAYATTSIGTYYSDDVTFTTLATTINVATAGTLSSLISSTDKTTLTKLILTGNIDARDVKCMRDELTNLAVLDISGVNIIAYSGIDGTQSGSASTIYPANEMPNSSFSNPNKNAGKNSLKSISLPKSITSIGASAFGYCKGLNVDFEIPNSVTSIGIGVFFGCENIKSVMLGSKVTSIGLSAFNQCKALNAFSVDPENLNYSSSEGILFDKNKTILIQYPSAKQGVSYIIPNSITSIGDDAFGYCLKLTDVVIPNSVTSIGYGAFGSCAYLTSITIPNSVTSLDGYAFGNCQNLTNVSIGNKVTLLPSQAFDGCVKLSSIVIPNLVKGIDFYAFNNCTKLTSVTIPKSVTSIGSCTFSNCGSLTSVYAFGTTPVDLSSGSSPNVFNGVDKAACTLYVPLGSKSAYQAAVQWKDFLNIVEIFPPSVSTGLPSSITTTGAMVTSTVTAEGSAPVTARGVCWSISANPTIANNITSDGSGVGEFTSSLTGLTSGFAYHIRAYATNDIGTAYGDDLTFTTLYTAPTVTTTAASSITSTSAISGGNVTNVGTSSVTARGVCWSTSANPTIADKKTTDGTGAGVFSSSLTGLKSSLTYHIRAYATTAVGTSYGSDLTILTTTTGITDERMELITLYPNPVSDVLHVKGFEGSGSFSMTDISGRVVIDKRIASDELIGISGLPKGVYIVKIVTTNGIIEKKVIKK